MATGRLSFTGAASGAIMDAVLHQTPVAAGRINPQVPAELDRVIQKALEKDRALRYQHASELRADLVRARRDTGPDSPMMLLTAASPRQRNRWMWGLIAAA